jgi:hypothetical protein
VATSSPISPQNRSLASPTVGRAKTTVFAALRAQGIGWKRIAAEMGVGGGTIYRFALEGFQNSEKGFFERSDALSLTVAYLSKVDLCA